MNAYLVRTGAKTGGIRLILPNINCDLRALPAIVDADAVDPAKAVVLDKGKPVRRPTDPQLYELRIEVLPAERAAHPSLKASITGVAPLFALLDSSGRQIASTTLDLAAEFAKSTKLLPNTLQYFIEAQTFSVSAQISESASLTVKFKDQGVTLSTVVLTLDVSDLILLGDGEIPSRLYIADIDDNQPTLLEVKEAARAAGVPVVTVPSAVCYGDTWLQDQFQLALAFDDVNLVQTVVVHLPRMLSNAQVVNKPNNLAAFVDNHFPSSGIGVFKDLWNTSIRFDVKTSDGKPSEPLSVRDSNAVLNSLLPVTRMWEQIETAIGALKGTTAQPDQPVEFFTKREQLATKLEVLKATPAKNPDQEPEKDTLTASLDQKLAGINKTIPLLARAVRLTIKEQTVEVSEQALNDLFDRLMELHSGTNHGGNIEVAPPTPDAPFGKVVIGDVRERDLRTLIERLGAQDNVQPCVEVDTSWLSVGHIDEIACFISPASTGLGSPVVLRASPKIALALLDAAKNAQGSGVLVTRLFRGKKWRHEEDQSITDPLYPPRAYQFLVNKYGYDRNDFRSASIRVPSAYYDDRKYLRYRGGNASARQYAAHTSVQEVLDICRDTNRTIDDVFLAGKGKGKGIKQSDYPLLAGLSHHTFTELLEKTGLDMAVTKAFPSVTLIPLPVLFDRVDRFATWTTNGLSTRKALTPDSSTEALTPDLVNLQQLGLTLLVPRPYGPRLRPSDALTLLRPLVDDNTILGLPSSIRQALLKLLTVTNLHSRGLDVTTHWTSPSQSCQRWFPGARRLAFQWGAYENYDDAFDTIDVVAEIFRDGFDEFKNPDRDYTKNDTVREETARRYFDDHIPLICQRIQKANPRAYAADGHLNLSGNTWIQVTIPENTVDLFEVYTQLLLEALGFTVKWVDSWYYHVHGGGVHCATNVLRSLAPSELSRRRGAAAQKRSS